MSWLEEILSQGSIKEGQYYTAIDPADFYEWKFLNKVPKGAIFTRQVPRSDTFTKGFVVISANLSANQLSQREDTYETTDPIDTDVTLTIGSISTPEELLTKFDRMKKDFGDKVDCFRKASSVHRYVVSVNGDPSLYKMIDLGEKAQLTNFGTVEDLWKRLKEAKQAYQNLAYKKKGRAYEMSRLHKLEQTMTFIGNKSVPLDSEKIDGLIHVAKVPIYEEYEIPWPDCYMKFHPSSEEQINRINTISSLKWVESTRRFLQKT